MCPHCGSIASKTLRERGIETVVCARCGVPKNAYEWSRASDTRRLLRQEREARVNPPAVVTKIA